MGAYPTPKREPSRLAKAIVGIVVVVIALYAYGKVRGGEAAAPSSDPGRVAAQAAIGAASGGLPPKPTPKPTRRPTPEPSGEATLSHVTVTSRAWAGDDVRVKFHAVNLTPGTVPMVMKISGIDGKGEVVSCRPRCEAEEVMGRMYLDFPDLKPGAKRDYVITVRTLQSGPIEWVIEDKEDDGDDAYEGITVVI